MYYQLRLTAALNDCASVVVNGHLDEAVNQPDLDVLNVMVMDVIITDEDFRVKVAQVATSYEVHAAHLDYFQTFLMSIMNFLDQMHYYPTIEY